MDFILCCPDSSHVPVGSCPSISASVFLFLFSQVVPSPVAIFRRSLGLVSPNHLNLAFSLMLSFLTLSLGVCPHAHLHIIIYVTSSFFTWELVIGIVAIRLSMHNNCNRLSMRTYIFLSLKKNVSMFLLFLHQQCYKEILHNLVQVFHMLSFYNNVTL